MTTRREFMACGAAALATATVAAPAFAQWRPNERYPDPALYVNTQGTPGG